MKVLCGVATQGLLLRVGERCQVLLPHALTPVHLSRMMLYRELQAYSAN